MSATKTAEVTRRKSPGELRQLAYQRALFAHHLVQERLKAGITLNEISRESGLAKATINKFPGGKGMSGQIAIEQVLHYLFDGRSLDEYDAAAKRFAAKQRADLSKIHYEALSNIVSKNPEVLPLALVAQQQHERTGGAEDQTEAVWQLDIERYRALLEPDRGPKLLPPSGGPGRRH